MAEATPVVSIDVPSRSEWVATPAWVTAGQRLVLSASGTWVDAFIPCSAEGYSAPLFYAAGHPPRIPDGSRFFRLMGRIVANGEQPTSDDPGSTFPIGAGAALTAPTAGRLFVFCNDREGFYWNNWGSVTLVIQG